MPAAYTFGFEAIGTAWEIELPVDLEEVKVNALHKKIFQRIEEFDIAYSRFRKDSLVTCISEHAGSFTLPADAGVMLDLYKSFYDITQGKITPLIGQTLSDAGYDATYTLTPKPLRAPPKWEDVMAFEKPVLKTKQPVLLDFGAAGKGYLIDIIAKIIKQSGIKEFCIDAGGDMAAAGKTLEVGLEDPTDTSKVIGVAHLANASLCGSAGNRRSWAGYNHILDPALLKSPGHLQAVWVVAASTMLADALTTALYFTSPMVLSEHFEFEYAMLDSADLLTASNAFPADFFARGAAQ